MSKKKYHRTVRRGGLSPERYLTKAQGNQMKDYLIDQIEKGPTLFHKTRAATNLMLFVFMVNTGLRSNEVINIQIRDLPCQHKKSVINVRKGRFKIQRSVTVSKKLMEQLDWFLAEWRKYAKPKSFLFVNEDGGQLSYRSLYSKIIRAGKNSGVGHVTPHMLRHTYATLVYNINKDIYKLMDNLGHSKPETTAIYAKTDDEESQRQADNFFL